MRPTEEGFEQSTVPLREAAPVLGTTVPVWSMTRLTSNGTKSTIEPSGEWILAPSGAQSVGSASVPRTIVKFKELSPPIAESGMTAVNEVVSKVTGTGVVVSVL